MKNTNTNYVQSQTPYSIISQMNNGWIIFQWMEYSNYGWKVAYMNERSKRKKEKKKPCHGVGSDWCQTCLISNLRFGKSPKIEK